MYSFVTTPDRFPHKCLNCGAGAGTDREWYVDFGENMDGPEEHILWTIYLCNICVTDVAGKQGIVPRAPLDAQIENTRSALFDQTNKADGLEQAFDGLIRARIFKPNDLPSPELGVLLGEFQAEGQTTGSGQGSSQIPGEHAFPAVGISDESSDDSDVAGLRPALFLDGGPAGIRS